MRGSRGPDGATLIELLVAFAASTLVIGLAIGLSTAVNRMGRAGDLAGALQEATLVLACLERDFMQVAFRSSPPGPAIEVTPDRVSLQLAEMRPDGTVGGIPVVYERVPAVNGMVRLKRVGAGTERVLPALLRGCEIARLAGPGGGYVRVTLRVASHAGPTDGGRSTDEAILSSLVRCAGPDLEGTKVYSTGRLLLGP